MNIDIHAHYIPVSCIELEKTDPVSFMISINDPATSEVLHSHSEPTAPFAEGAVQIFDIDRRLQDMTNQRIDLQVLSVTSGCYFYGEPPDTARVLCEQMNDAFAATVALHPDHFVALANLPMQSPEAAAHELQRTVVDLGFRGAVIGSTINDLALDDKSLAPFYARAQELDVPVFVHPGYVPALNRISRYLLSNLLGFPGETAFAAASLIFGGVLKEFPRLKVCLAHGGGCCSGLSGRWDHGWRELPLAGTNISEPPSHYLRCLYYDSLVFDNSLLEFLIQSVGTDHVLLGTDYPTRMGNFNSVEDVDSLALIEAPEKAAIRGLNAQALFKIG